MSIDNICHFTCFRLLDVALYPREAANRTCLHFNLEAQVVNLRSCQASCEINGFGPCAGVAYSSKENAPGHLKPRCIICHDDALTPSADEFSFYRRPGKQYSTVQLLLKKMLLLYIFKYVEI